MQKRNTEAAERLYKAVAGLKNEDECRRFFEDVCTIQEIETISQRLQVAQLLLEGKSYSQVNKLTGASTTTVCRVARSINYGSGGYGIAIEKNEKEQSEK